MATPYKFVFGPQDLGTFHKGGYNEAAAKKLGELLQQNIEKWHIIYMGFRHNHIVHCLFSAYALGATAEELQVIYDREESYQAARYPVNERDVKAMADKVKFRTYVGQQPHYSSFLLFFQREIERKGVKATLEEHLFAGDDYANEFLTRFYTSIFHPYLHIGYAFEFNQPAIVAEALAMASVHDPAWATFLPFYTEAEEAAVLPKLSGEKTLRRIMVEARHNETFQKSIDGESLIRAYNVVSNAPEESVRAASEYAVSEEQLDNVLDEMIDTVCK
ncbi:hypothetical protein BGZ61DRAFT_373557 [Ilyonectria robusta]|uniref:uncharacterized protein n=1 Tax=Ilyonectria robusta TaxID=1079257 RepID=UPI001E8DA2ED|nr:uncharacterized protein BGZ61DRAFT_373557 [Ilyonectria robusta]KAH8654398.1 hypothetical protein BGZ61DRAFT_373557 [Ilyonectria robusta]